jgi:hypothetical protein
MKKSAKMRKPDTGNGRVLKQTFDGAFQAVHKEAINAAVALGYKPGKGLRRAVDLALIESGPPVGCTKQERARLPRPISARINCEEIILFLLDWPECADPLQPFTDEIEDVCKLLDELQRDLAVAIAA